MGPRCPACSSKVKLPKGRPPMPNSKVKCPSCGSVGELEVFLQAAGFEEESAGVTIPVAEEPALGALQQVKAVAVAENQSHSANNSAQQMQTTAVSEEPAAPASDAEQQAQTVALHDDPGVTKVAGSATKLNLPPGLRCTLSVLTGPDSGKKMKITKARVVVGQDGADFPLTDPQVAKEHCAFEITGVTCTVKDLESPKGTFVDGVNVTSHVLSKVGEVTVGNTTLLFAMTLEEMLPSE